MVIAEFTMSPFDKGDSISPYVARVLDVIDNSGLNYRLTPMSTIMEGDWEDVFAVVTQCYEALKPDCRRIVASVKIDYRAGDQSRLTSKIEAVEGHLGRKLIT